MTDLTEFLLARIADTERAVAVAGEVGVRDFEGKPMASAIAIYDDDRTLLWSTDVLLADCEAKRELIELGGDFVQATDNTICNDEWAAGRYVGRTHFHQDETLRLLALPYASHPDYLEEWRP